jgi:hypothetical protein
MAYAQAKKLPGYAKLDEFMATVEGFTGEFIEELKANNVLIYQCILKEHEVLNVPMGYVMLERASAAKTLVYGLRRSYFFRSERCLKVYTILRELFSAQGRNVGRMDLICAKMGPGT